ncbi:autotransporter assembly complex protein TamA [Pseudidiomarina taiwanensis]|nr:autotransporter assembly complex family protein [Pseudidiomarina taiwanensis]
MPSLWVKFCRILILACALVGLSIAHAIPQSESPADGKILRVAITGLASDLEQNAEQFMDIMQLDDQPISSRFRLRYLMRRGQAQITEALQPFGYYHSNITTELEETATELKLTYTVALGQPTKIASLNLNISGAGATDPSFQALQQWPQLQPGQQFVHSEYERLKARLLGLAAERGYYDARLLQQTVKVELSDFSAIINLDYDTGRRYRFAALEFCCNELDPDFLARFPQFKAGDYFSTDALFDLQAQLMSTNYFTNVELSPRWDERTEEFVPTEIIMTPNQRNRYQLGLGYGTDTGARATFGFDRRWVNRRGHKFSSLIRLSELENTGSFNYQIPGNNPTIEHYDLLAEVTDTSYLQQYSTLYRIAARDVYNHERWQRTYQLTLMSEDFRFGTNPTQSSSFLIPSVEWSLIESTSSTNNRNLIDDGYRLSLTLQGATESILAETDFISAKMTGKWVHRLSPAWRILARGELGILETSNFNALPPSLRFFTGGDYSVRGYAFRQLGPSNDEGVIISGRYLVASSLEVDYQITDNWRIAAFTDLGNTLLSWDAELKQSIGVGVRWVSPLGPIRLDLAQAIDEPGSPWRIHFTLGPDL